VDDVVADVETAALRRLSDTTVADLATAPSAAADGLPRRVHVLSRI
jgi:hypothetical protein